MSMARALRSPVAGAAVDAYDRHVGRYGGELAREMVRVTGVRAGQRALDVGCGTGALTVMLAEVLGAGNVAAIDPSERFVAACRDRAPGADLRVGIGEELPWSDAEFDTVLAQLVVYGMNDARRGAAEMRRVARPGGTVRLHLGLRGGHAPPAGGLGFRPRRRRGARPFVRGRQARPVLAPA